MTGPAHRTPRAQRNRIVGVVQRMLAEAPPLDQGASAQGGVAGVPEARRLGWLPELSVSSACGLLLIAFGDARARADASWVDTLFWTGLLLLYVPIVARLAMPSLSSSEGSGLVVVLALGTYLVKVMHSPTQFTFPDEFIHLRTAGDMLRSHHLFHLNPMLPVSALYPGLENVTTALVHLSGLGIYDAGLIVAGVSRLVLLLSLYLLADALTHSRRIAGLTTVLYAGNSNFIFFNAQFKYETLALAFAALALVAMVRRAQAQERGRAAYTVVSMLMLVACAITHHLTSYVLAGFLALWTFAALYSGWRAGRQAWRWPAALLGLSIVFNVGWLLSVAPATIGYLAPVFSGAVSSVLHLIIRDSGSQPGRTLFHSGTGTVPTPLWERGTTLLSVLVILSLLPLGLLHVARRYRSNALVLALAVVSLVYPASLAFRLTGQGWETANRSSESVFVGLSLILALALVGNWLVRRPTAPRALAVAGIAGILLVGGVVAGWPYEWRMPRPYLVAQDPRSIEPQGMNDATWSLRYLGPNNVVAADRTNLQLFGTYGEQHVTTTISGGIDASWILYSSILDQDKLNLLQQGQVKYVVVDRRLMAAPWLAARYFDNVDMNAALGKFDQTFGVSRIFDSGDIAIYDVGALSGVP